MQSIHPKFQKNKPPIFMAIILAALAILFPGWSIQASRKPRRPRQFSHTAYLAALDNSLRFGYASVNWDGVR